MALDTYALTTVEAVKAYIGDDIEKDAFWVYYSGAASSAVVHVDDDTLRLKHNDAADAALDLTAAAYDTIGELVAYINASVADWEAGQICHSSAESADLLETGEIDALGESKKQTLKIVDNYLIERLIDRATDFIERYCSRKLKTRSYTNEQYYGTNCGDLFLDQYPVTRVNRVQTGRANSFSIKNTSTDANFCTVEVTSSAMRLIVDGGTNADDTSLTLADYATIDLLIAAIHALGKGWSCTTLATDTDSRDADEILQHPALAVTSTKQAYIETGDESLTDYQVVMPSESRNYGLIRRPGTWLSNTEYHVSYTAGYTTIPYALEQACIELVKLKYGKGKQDSGKKSEKIGNVYAYENFGPADLKYGISSDIQAALDYFRRREF